MKIDAVLGGMYDKLGELIKASGQEDSSGLRRALLAAFEERNYALADRLLGANGAVEKFCRERLICGTNSECSH